MRAKQYLRTAIGSTGNDVFDVAGNDGRGRAQTARCRSAIASVLLAVAVGCTGGEPANQANQRNGDTGAAIAGVEASSRAAGCELLTTAEIEAAMGAAPARSEEGDPRTRGCDWYSADGRPLVGVIVGVTHRAYEDYVQDMRKEMGSYLEGIEMSRVHGVGDYAVWHELGGPDYLNAVKEGELLVVMLFSDPTSGKSKQAAAIELARKALPRL